MHVLRSEDDLESRSVACVAFDGVSPYAVSPYAVFAWSIVPEISHVQLILACKV
jgi:hypothetical protein